MARRSVQFFGPTGLAEGRVDCLAYAQRHLTKQEGRWGS